MIVKAIITNNRMRKILILMLGVFFYSTGFSQTLIDSAENPNTSRVFRGGLGVPSIFTALPNGTFTINGSLFLTTLTNTIVAGDSMVTVSTTGFFKKMAIPTSGTGTVTNFSSGGLSPLFSVGITNSTSTPTVTYTSSNAAANTVYGNHTGSSAVPTFSQIVGSDIATNTIAYSNFQTLPTGTLFGSINSVTATGGAVTMGSGVSLSTGGVLSAIGTGGTLTSITPGYGFNSSTPITSIGTLTIDTTKILNKIVIAPVITSGTDSTPTPLYFHKDTLYSYVATSNHDGWLTNTTQTITGQKTFTSQVSTIGQIISGLNTSGCSIIESGTTNPLLLEAIAATSTTTGYGIGIAAVPTGAMPYGNNATSGEYDEVRIAKDTLKATTGTTKLVGVNIPTILSQAAAATGDVSLLMININDRGGFHGTNELLIDAEADSVKKFTVTTGGTIKVYGNDTTIGNSNLATQASSSRADSGIAKNSSGTLVSIPPPLTNADTSITGQLVTKTRLSATVPQQASAYLTAQTAALPTLDTYTPPSNVLIRIGGYINITAVTLDVIQMQVTYTDENSNSVTKIFSSQSNTGTVSVGLSAVGNSDFIDKVIYAKSGTTITIATVLTTGTGTIMYDAGVNITSLN